MSGAGGLCAWLQIPEATRSIRYPGAGVTVVSWLTWVLEIEPGSSARARCALNQ